MSPVSEVGTLEVQASEAVEGTDTALVSPETPAVEVPETPPSPTPEPTPDSPPASLEAPAADPVVTTFQPPKGAEVFAVKADGTPITIEGAVKSDGWIHIPEAAWPAFQSRHVGDRGQWRQERAQLHGRLRELESGQAQVQNEESVRAKALVAKVTELFSDPEKLRAAYENWAVEGPVLQAKAEAEVARQQLQRYRQDEQRQQDAERERQYEPVIKDVIGLGIESVLDEMGATAAFQDGKGGWSPEAGQLLDHLFGLTKQGLQLVRQNPLTGQLEADRDLVYGYLSREVAKVQRKQEQAKQTETKKALNAAAVKPTKPGSGPAKPVAKPSTAQPVTSGEPDYRTDPDKWDEWFRKL